jgi:hypothetical protein
VSLLACLLLPLEEHDDEAPISYQGAIKSIAYPGRAGKPAWRRSSGTARGALRQQVARQEAPRSRGRTPPPVDEGFQPTLFAF